MNKTKKDSKQKHLSITELMISVIIEIVFLLGMYYYCTIFNLPIGLTASLILFAFFLYLTLSNYNSLDKPKRAYFVGLTLAAFILSSLFAYKHFVSDIRITVLHIGGIILAPFFLSKILEKKSKGWDGWGRTKTTSSNAEAMIQKWPSFEA